MIARVARFAFDAALVSVTLAGIRRSTNLTLKTDEITSSPEIQKWVDKYLYVGDAIYKQAVVLMGASKYFELDSKTNEKKP